MVHTDAEDAQRLDDGEEHERRGSRGPQQPDERLDAALLRDAVLIVQVFPPQSGHAQATCASTSAIFYFSQCD